MAIEWRPSSWQEPKILKGARTIKRHEKNSSPTRKSFLSLPESLLDRQDSSIEGKKSEIKRLGLEWRGENTQQRRAAVCTSLKELSPVGAPPSTLDQAHRLTIHGGKGGGGAQEGRERAQKKHDSREKK